MYKFLIETDDKKWTRLYKSENVNITYVQDKHCNKFDKIRIMKCVETIDEFTAVFLLRQDDELLFETILKALKEME